MANHKKFVQFYHVYKKEMASTYIEKILDREGDINDYIIFENSCLLNKESHLIGSTVLHFVQNCRRDTNTLKILLKRGANFVIKDRSGSTVLHSSIKNEFYKYKNIWKSRRFEDKDEFVDLILEAHITSENYINPCDNNGLSHFHIACMTNNYKAVEFFLQNGVTVEHAVNKDSEVFPGYTSLHLAVEHCAYNTAKLLLKYGASINDQNTNGITPLDLLLMQRLKIMDLYNGQMLLDDILPSDEINEKLIHLFLENCSPNVFIDNSGLSYLHVVCTLRDLLKVEQALRHTNDIDHCVDENSVLWSGYTALHFAAHCNVNTVKLLLDKGASMEMKNKEGKTPIDLCLGRYKIENIHKILSSHSIWKDMVMSDGETKLTDLVYAMRSFPTLTNCLRQHDDNIDMSIPFDSTCGPGYTTLHLAVIFLRKTHKALYALTQCGQSTDLELSVLQGLLNHGANVVHQDARGRTPIHLAFSLGNMRAVNLLLEFHQSTENPVDGDNLSHLHIACAAQNQKVVKNLMMKNIDVNSSVLSTFEWFNMNADSQEDRIFFINTGSTALHICVANYCWNLAKLLLNHGGDVCSKDANGLTPIHRILTLHSSSSDLSRVLLCSPNLVECIEDTTKLSHLHVASFAGHVSSVRRLLDLGGDIDIAISHRINYNPSELIRYSDPSQEVFLFAAKYDGFTPFHFAITERNENVAQLLIQQGSEVLLRNYGNSTPLLSSASGDYSAIVLDILHSSFKVDSCIQERFKKSRGLTLLHLACFQFDANMVKCLLVGGADVNARIHSQSCVWAGCTPLHILMIDSDNIYFGHSSLFIRHYNARQSKIDVILTLLLEYGADVTLSNAANDTPLHMKKSSFINVDGNSALLTLMLRSQKNFRVNPVSCEGISHFHIACCLNDKSIVKEYLENGVDVNESTNEFVHEAPSSTSLHLAMKSTSLDTGIINILLEYGANVNARDAVDNTPLHLACQYQMNTHKNLLRNILHKFFKHGADINIQNVYGVSPLLQLVEFGITKKDIALILQHGINLNQFNAVTEEGCIAKMFYQHFCRSSITFEQVINYLDVHEVDDMGRTIIHNIVSLNMIWSDKTFKGLEEVICRFVKEGVDIDHQDKLGRTALHMAAKFENRAAILAVLHAGGDVNIIDANQQSAYQNIIQLHSSCPSGFTLCGHGLVYNIFMRHINDLLDCRFHVSELNRQIHMSAFRRYHNFPIQIDDFHEELIKMEFTSVANDSLTLYDFMSETGAVAHYPHMFITKRQVIGEFFKSVDVNQFPRLKGLLNLQYKKALARSQLEDEAKGSFDAILKFPLPDVCSTLLFRCLANADLKSIIEATT